MIETRFVARALRWRFVLPLLVLLWTVYLIVLHPWLMNWGATSAEVTEQLPGDELATGRVSYFTRAITIHASQSAIWPWLVQMGQDRGGFYSNTWLENMTGADIHNANSVHPEWQQRAIGDTVPLARPDLLFGLGALGRTHIVALQPPLLISNVPARIVLQPVDDRTTRLLIRESNEPDPGLDSSGEGPVVIRWLVWDPMHFVMVQRMLRGIKERAEGSPLVPSALVLTARVGWLLAAASVLGLFVVRRRLRPLAILPVSLVLPALWSTGDWDAALAGFLAIAFTLLGVLELGHRWCPAFLLLVSAVLLMLLFAPDPYTAFGLTFCAVWLLVLAIACGRFAVQRTRPAMART